MTSIGVPHPTTEILLFPLEILLFVSRTHYSHSAFLLLITSAGFIVQQKLSHLLLHGD
jgi:hypothetical protein